MSLIIVGLVAALAILVALLLGALEEMFRQLNQLRGAAGLVDVSIAVDAQLGAELPAEHLGYRNPTREGQAQRHVLLFVSDSCTTCAQVVQGLPAKFTPQFMVVVESPDTSSAERWIQRSRLDQFPQVRRDSGRRVATALSMNVVPSVAVFEHNRLIGAHTVPSKRYIRPLLDWVNEVGPYPFDTDSTEGEPHHEHIDRT